MKPVTKVLLAFGGGLGLALLAARVSAKQPAAKKSVTTPEPVAEVASPTPVETPASTTVEEEAPPTEIVQPVKLQALRRYRIQGKTQYPQALKEKLLGMGFESVDLYPPESASGLYTYQTIVVPQKDMSLTLPGRYEFSGIALAIDEVLGEVS